MPRYAFGTTDSSARCPNFYEIRDLPDDATAKARLRDIVMEVYPQPAFRIEIVRDWSDLRWSNAEFECCWEVPADYVEGRDRWSEIELRQVQLLNTVEVGAL